MMKKGILLSLILLASLSLFAQPWSRVIGGTGGASIARGQNIIRTSNGGYIIAGQTTAFGNTTDLFLVKIDALGGLVWSQTYNSGGNEICLGLNTNNTGDLVLTGQTSGFGGPGDGDAFAICVDTANGNILWDFIYRKTGSERFFANAIQLPGGDYVFGGAKGKVLTASSFTGGIMVRFTPGISTPVWAREFSSISFANLYLASNGDVLVGGSNVGTPGYDLFRINPATGGTLIRKSYQGSATDQFGYYPVEGANQEIYLLGSDGTFNNNNRNIVVVKADSALNLKNVWRYNSSPSLYDVSFASIQITPSGNLFMPIYSGNYPSNYNGGVLEMDSTTGAVITAKLFGGSQVDGMLTMSPLSGSNEVLLAGFSDSYALSGQTGSRNMFLVHTSLDTASTPCTNLPITINRTSLSGFSTVSPSAPFAEASTSFLDSNFVRLNVTSQTKDSSLCGPALTFSSGNPKCAGGSDGFITVFPSGGQPPYTYLWNTGATTQSINAIPAGTYSVTVTDALGASANGNVTLTNPAPVVVNAGPDMAICLGDSAQLNGSSGSAVSFSWSPPAGLSNLNIPNPKASPAATIIYTLTAFDATGCSGSDDVKVTVNPVPQLNLLDSIWICEGDSAFLQAEGSGFINCVWTPAAGIANPNSCATMASPAQTTTYYLTVTNAEGCSLLDSITVVVESNCCSALGLSAMFAVNLNGLQVSLTDLSAGNDINVLHWDFGDGSMMNTFAGQTVNHTFAGNGTYNICLTIASFQPNNICCKDSVCIPVTIDVDTCDFYQAAFSVYQSPGGWYTANYTDVSSLGSTFVIWHFGDGDSLMVNGSGGTVSHSYPSAGWYTVQMVSVSHIDSVICCIDTASRQVYIKGPFIFGSGTKRINGFPNPALDEVTIGYVLNEEATDETVSLRLYDRNGQIVREIPDYRNADGLIQIDLRGLAEGIYMAEVKGEGFLETTKIIKQYRNP